MGSNPILVLNKCAEFRRYEQGLVVIVLIHRLSDREGITQQQVSQRIAAVSTPVRECAPWPPSNLQVGSEAMVVKAEFERVFPLTMSWTGLRKMYRMDQIP